MKRIFFIAVFLLVAGRPAQAGVGTLVGYVGVSTITATAMISTTAAVGMYAFNICNDSDTLRCGYDVTISTISGNAAFGFPILINTCAYRAVQNIPYCKSTSSKNLAPAVVEVFK